MNPSHRAARKLPIGAVRIGTCLIALAVLAGGLAGCRTFNKHITEAVLDGGETKQWNIHYGSTHRYRLNNESLEEIAFEGTVEGPRISVRYQKGLADQAGQIAEQTAQMLEQVEQRIGMEITTRSTIQLLRFDAPPQNFTIHLTVEPNEFPLPMFVRAGDESYGSILAQNPSYPYLFVHELVETSLVCSQKGGQVLPDLGWGALGISAHVNNYTRWFRDGLANYAGFVAQAIIAAGLDDFEPSARAESVLHTRPFSSLARIRGKLFSWPQSSPKEQQREYYDAALGLFLVLEARFGEEAIRAIMQEIASHKAVDRRDLVRIASRTLGTDLRKIVREFEFPRSGLQLTRITPALALNEGLDVDAGLFVDAVEPNSLSDRAGLAAKDVILAADSAPLTGALDFELALFRAREKPLIPLSLWRAEKGMMTVKIPLRLTRRQDSQLAESRLPPAGDDTNSSGFSRLAP